ncbi:alpha/beta hydrolase [Streptomyces sp. NPDC087658]|uniref:alpha/beta hydrolase n=1 Tax=Streptomyces sp. NPDC087658 TaxID=3365800 RepID=UPI00382C20AD
MKRPTALGALSLSLVALAPMILAPALASAGGVEAHRPLASSPGAGDGLDRFRNQPVNWTVCQDTALAASGTRCARITVPLDYGKPRGRTIEVALSRIASTDPAKRRGILQTDPGGPGARGLGMPGELRKVMSPGAAAAYDIIGMDTRGLGESTPLDCGLARGTWLHSPGADRAGFDTSVRLSREDARRCWATHPDVLPHLSTRNIARDLDLVRSVLGERRTSLLGQSYGTVLASTYAQMFPHRVDRLVLDSAPDPAEYPFRMVRRAGPANENALDDFARWAAPRHPEYGLGATPEAVRTGVEAMIGRAAQEPIRLDRYRITDHELPLLLLISIGDDTANPEFAGMLRVLLDAADGKPVTVPPGLRASLTLILESAGTGRAADYAAQLGIYCADSAMPHDPEYYWRAVERSRESQPVFGPVSHAPLPCAFWKEKPREPLTVIDNEVPALQVQATGDTRTTYESGLGMHRAMRGSKLVTVPARTHTVYAHYPNDCVTRAVNTYLRHGTLPAQDTLCANEHNSRTPSGPSGPERPGPRGGLAWADQLPHS